MSTKLISLDEDLHILINAFIPDNSILIEAGELVFVDENNQIVINIKTIMAIVEGALKSSEIDLFPGSPIKIAKSFKRQETIALKYYLPQWIKRPELKEKDTIEIQKLIDIIDNYVIYNYDKFGKLHRSDKKPHQSKSIQEIEIENQINTYYECKSILMDKLVNIRFRDFEGMTVNSFYEICMDSIDLRIKELKNQIIISKENSKNE